MADQTIKCPNCGNAIDIDDVLTHQTEERVRAEMREKYAEQQEQFNKKATLLADQEKQMADFKAKEKEVFNDRLQKELAKQLEEKGKMAALKMEEENNAKFANQFKALEEMLVKEKEKNKELNVLQVERLKLQNQLKEQKESAELESEKKILAAKEQIEIAAKKRENEKWELKEKELLKKIDDQIKLTEEMKRKQEQGSMQLQGEIQELAIEDFLIRNFAIDEIIEIKKGARGGDCIQVVKNNLGMECGKIYYESKRTKDFQPTWVAKFKDDMRSHKGDIGVIVTQAMPKDMDRFGMRDGIWICTYEDFKGLCFALREGLIRVSEIKSSQENRGDKMSMLYDYFTSQTFKDTFRGMMDVFKSMKEDLDKEKRAMTSIWKVREKQIERFLLNAQNMEGSIKGIAGNNSEFLEDLTNLGLPE